MKTTKKMWVDFSYYLYPSGLIKPIKTSLVKKNKKMGGWTGQIKKYNTALGKYPQMMHHKEP